MQGIADGIRMQARQPETEDGQHGFTEGQWKAAEEVYPGACGLDPYSMDELHLEHCPLCAAEAGSRRPEPSSELEPESVTDAEPDENGLEEVETPPKREKSQKQFQYDSVFAPRLTESERERKRYSFPICPQWDEEMKKREVDTSEDHELTGVHSEQPLVYEPDELITAEDVGAPDLPDELHEAESDGDTSRSGSPSVDRTNQEDTVDRTKQKDMLPLQGADGKNGPVGNRQNSDRVWGDMIMGGSSEAGNNVDGEAQDAVNSSGSPPRMLGKQMQGDTGGDLLGKNIQQLSLGVDGGRSDDFENDAQMSFCDDGDGEESEIGDLENDPRFLEVKRNYGCHVFCKYLGFEEHMYLCGPCYPKWACAGIVILLMQWSCEKIRQTANMMYPMSTPTQY